MGAQGSSGSPVVKFAVGFASRAVERSGHPPSGMTDVLCDASSERRDPGWGFRFRSVRPGMEVPFAEWLAPLGTVRKPSAN